jgi:hypothetical protein
MAVERQFIVKLLADPKQLIADFQLVRGEAEKTFGISNAKLQQLLPGFKVLTTAAAGVFGGLVAGAGLAVKAAAENEAAQQRLAQILRTTGKATSDQIKGLNEQADALERVGVVSGGNITALQAQLATFDLQADTIAKLTPAIADYVVAEKGATASAEDFKSMTNGLAQALNGQFGALTRVGFVLDDTTKELISNGTEAERAAALVEVLNSTYGGFNASLRETTEGRMIALRNSLGKLQEDIGKILLPLFENLVGVLAKFASFAAQNSTIIAILAGGVGVLSVAILGLAGYLKIAALQKRALNDEFLKGLVTFKTAEGQMTATGKAIVGVGKALAVVAAAEGTFAVVNAVGNSAAKTADQVKALTVALNEFGKAGEKEPEKVLEEFTRLAQTIGQELRLKDIFIQFGREFQLVANGISVDIELADEAFRKFLDSDPQKAAAIVQALQDQLAVTDPTSRAYQDLKDAIDRYRAAVNLTLAAQGKLNDELNKTSWFEKNTKGLADLKVAHNNEARARLASADSIKNWNTEAERLFNKAGSGKSAIEKLADAQKKLQDAVRGVFSAQIGERNAIERVTDAQKQLKNADEAVTKAKEKLAQAIRGYGRDSKEGAAAVRKLTDAQRNLTQANRGVADAQQRVLDAERKIAEIRAKAADPTEQNEAQLALEQSRLGLEEATIRVSEAEEELAKTLADPEASAKDKRKAELSLVSAKLSLRDATMDLGQAEKELAAIRAGTENAVELAEAERELTDAKISVEDAIYNQKKAQEELNAEQENYRKVVEGIRESDKEYVELSKDIVDAEENQASAARGLRDAREQAASATDSLRKAEEALRESRKEARGAGVNVKNVVAGVKSPMDFGKIPEPTANGNGNQNGGNNGATVIMNITNGIGGNAYQVGKELIEILDQYTSVAGPLDTLMRVA